MNIHSIIPPELIKLLLVLGFSLVIGLEQRRRHIHESQDLLFGTDRTFAFIGLLGYSLYLADSKTLIPFVCGFIVIGSFLGIHYLNKIKKSNNYGLTSSVVALLTYSLPIVIFTQPVWLELLFLVIILILVEAKNSLISLSQKASEEEFITLAKFIAFAGVILPILPDQPISTAIPVSPYKLWLAVVVVSGISYISYLLKKFVFPNSGILLTAILGGLYSSTATTLIISRQEKQGQLVNPVQPLMMANSMMYLRILALAFVFNQAVATLLLLPFGILFAVCLLASRFVGKSAIVNEPTQLKNGEKASENPLELKTALIFGLLFVFFAVFTNFILTTYGNSGVSTVAYIVGVTDIDPFLLNLLQHKESIELITIALAILNATNSNNLVKMIYALTITSKSSHRGILTGYLILFAVGVITSLALTLIL